MSKLNIEKRTKEVTVTRECVILTRAQIDQAILEYVERNLPSRVAVRTDATGYCAELYLSKQRDDLPNENVATVYIEDAPVRRGGFETHGLDNFCG